MTPKQILIEARNLIEKPDKWVNGGGRAGMDKCHCCQTAISAVAGNSEARPALVVFARQFGGTETDYLGCIWAWNDKPERKHAEVLEAFDKSIAVA